MSIKIVSDWQKYHKFQEKPGWCGPAVIQMVLLKAGIKKTQTEIKKYVYKEWWGTPQQLILAYLSKFFRDIDRKQDSTLNDISKKLKKGNIIIVNWWDDYDKENEDGHYSIIGDYDLKNKNITLVDPTNTRKGIWDIKESEFKKRWYDSMDVHDKKWIEGWMLWVDPKSKI